MTREDMMKLGLGLYRVFWKNDDRSSLAAVGMKSDGSRWLAPVNWVEPTLDEKVWDEVERLEIIE